MNLKNLDEVEDKTITVAESRQVIAGLIKQYPEEDIDILRQVSFACINYIYHIRMKFGEDDLCCHSMLVDGNMPAYSIIDDKEVELGF